MKKLVVLVTLAIICVAILLSLAFFYIALSGHENFNYDIYIDGALLGKATVNKYVTEDKIIYKNKVESPGSLGYPVLTQKLILRRKTRMPLKYTEEATGTRGAKQSLLLTQSEDKTDLLFMKCPPFFTLKGFETGEKTLIFSPYRLLLCMPLMMESYNHWKKGTQFFEIMIPLEEPMPVLRDKVEVRYLHDEYIPLMGRRIEAERFVIRSEGVPETIITSSRYAHSLLSVEINEKKMRFVLTGLHRKFEHLFSRLMSFKKANIDNEEKPAGKPRKSPDTKIQDSLESQEVFFESGNHIISGRLHVPEGNTPFPAAILVPEDGPMTNGEQFLLESLGRILSASGIAVLAFDSPGQGKSPGIFQELDDEKRIRDIQAAFSFLEDHPSVDAKKIMLVGHRGGGYLSLKAAGNIPPVLSCIVLGMPLEYGLTKTDTAPAFPDENIRQILDMHGFGHFDERYIQTMRALMEEQLNEVRKPGGDLLFFMGKKLPLKAYREYLDRKPYEAILAFNGPLLMVFDKEDIYFRPKIVKSLKSLPAGGKNARIAIFRDLGYYMGDMENKGGNRDFKLDRDVIVVIKKWIAELPE